MPTPEDRSFFEDLNASLANSLEKAITSALGPGKQMLIDMQSIRMIGTVVGEALKRNNKLTAAGGDGAPSAEGTPSSQGEKEKPLGTDKNAALSAMAKMGIVMAEVLAASKAVAASTRAIQSGLTYGDQVARTAMTTSNFALLKEQNIGESVAKWGRTLPEMGAAMENAMRSGVRDMQKPQMQFTMRMHGLGVSMGAMNTLTTNQNQLLGRNSDATRDLGNDTVDLARANGTFADAVVEAANSMIDFQKASESTWGGVFGQAAADLSTSLVAKLGGAFQQDIPNLFKGLIKTDVDGMGKMVAMSSQFGSGMSQKEIGASGGIEKFIKEVTIGIASESEQAVAMNGAIGGASFNMMMSETYGIDPTAINTMRQIKGQGGYQDILSRDDISDEGRAAEDSKIQMGILGHSAQAQENMLQFNVAVDNLNETFAVLKETALALNKAMKPSWLRDIITKFSGILGTLGMLISGSMIAIGGSLIPGMLKGTGAGGKLVRTLGRQAPGGGGFIDRFFKDSKWLKGSYGAGAPGTPKPSLDGMNRIDLRAINAAEDLNVPEKGTNKVFAEAIEAARKAKLDKIPKVKPRGKLGIVVAITALIASLFGKNDVPMAGEDEDEAVSGARGDGATSSGAEIKSPAVVANTKQQEDIQKKSKVETGVKKTKQQEDIQKKSKVETGVKKKTKVQLEVDRKNKELVERGSFTGQRPGHSLQTGEETGDWKYKGTGIFENKDGSNEGANRALAESRALYMHSYKQSEKITGTTLKDRRVKQHLKEEMAHYKQKAAIAIHGGGADYEGPYGTGLLSDKQPDFKAEAELGVAPGPIVYGSDPAIPGGGGQSDRRSEMALEAARSGKVSQSDVKPAKALEAARSSEASGVSRQLQGSFSGSKPRFSFETGKRDGDWTYKGTGDFAGKKGADLALSQSREGWNKAKAERDAYDDPEIAEVYQGKMNMFEQQATIAVRGGGADYEGPYSDRGGLMESVDFEGESDMLEGVEQALPASAPSTDTGGGGGGGGPTGGMPLGSEALIGWTTATTGVGLAQARAEKLAIEEAGSRAAYKAAQKKGGQGLGKWLLKKIPVIGLGAGILFGIGRAMQGDWKGAGMEVASGAAGTVPGKGTLASIAIDAALTARDISMAMDDAEKGAEQMIDGAPASAKGGSEGQAPKTALEAIAENTARLVEVGMDSRGIQEVIASRPVATQPEGVYNNTSVMSEINGDIESLVDAGLD